MEDTDKAGQILADRQEQHRGNMILCVNRIKRLAEAANDV